MNMYVEIYQSILVRKENIYLIFEIILTFCFITGSKHRKQRGTAMF